MSGGSYDYFYSTLESEYIYRLSKRANTPERKAFVKHLHKIAEAMKAIEWVDSGNWSNGDENESIMACITKTEVIQCAVEDAREMIKTLETIIGK